MEDPNKNIENTLSPEAQVTTELGDMVTAAIDAKDGVVTSTLEDGSIERSLIEAGGYGPGMKETTAPDGSKHYSYRSFYQQSGGDRGANTWTWTAGGEEVKIHTNSELESDSERVEIPSEKSSLMKMNIEYMASKFPDKETQRQRKGIVARSLGRLLRRRQS